MGLGLDMYVKRIRKPMWRDEFGMTVPSSVYDDLSLSGETLIRLKEDKLREPAYAGLAGFSTPVRVLQSYIDTDRIAREFTNGIPVSLGGMEMKDGLTVFRFYPVHTKGLPKNVRCVELDTKVIERDYRSIRLETQYVFHEENAAYWCEAGLLQEVIHSAVRRNLHMDVENLGYYRLDRDTAQAVLLASPGAFSWRDTDEVGATGLFYREWY